jgi:hypothetical protein
MAHLLRGKQAGVQGDFSAALLPESFAIDNVGRCEMKGASRLTTGRLFGMVSTHKYQPLHMTQSSRF